LALVVGSKLGTALLTLFRVAAFPARPQSGQGVGLEHDPEKWTPVFRKDHAPPKI
jgi:hypothetical protein